MDTFIPIALATGLLALYFGFRFGPKRCPDCRKPTWGGFGPPVGIRKMLFRCSRCGARFTGHSRLPL